jgi:ubiquinone/menaquinone biosynthesis C-methylase UbiE
LSSWNEKHRIRKCYNSSSIIYNKRYFEEQKNKYEYALKQLKLKPSDKILDVGCGSGLLFDFFNSKVEMIVGVDISDKLLKKAKNQKTKKNVHLILTDVDHLPIKNNYFDIIFVFTILQNMPNPVNTLKEIKVKAKNTGKIIITGMKKVYSLKNFREMIVNAGFNPLIIETNTNLKDYVAISVNSGSNS